MHLLTLVCLLFLGGASDHQEATWNIKYENAAKKAPVDGEHQNTSESPSQVSGWPSSSAEDDDAASTTENIMYIYNDGAVECPLEDDIFYIAGFCTFYITCKNGYPDFFKCTNGMHYNADEQKCDLPIRAGCELQCTQPNGIFGIPGKCDKYLECVDDIAELKFCPENLHFSQLHHSCVPPKKASCEFTCPDDYGFYPLLGYCDIYVKCQDGEVKFQRCPFGLHFNNNIKMCDLPERATCAESCPKPDGVFPVEGDSSAYTNCTNNVPKLNFCEEEYTFNFKSSRCDPPEVDKPAHKCPSPNGRFTFPGSRTELFIECINDTLSIRNCPPKLHLNTDTGICDY